MNKLSIIDLVEGESFKSHARTVTETDLVMYTSMAGLKVPIFTDETFVKKNTHFGGRIFPGLLTATIATGLLEELLSKHLIAALELGEFKFKHPVKPGNTLSATVTVQKRRETSDGKRLIVDALVTVLNELEAEVMSFTERLMLRKS
mgnify:CR=1 FL=1